MTAWSFRTPPACFRFLERFSFVLLVSSFILCSAFAQTLQSEHPKLVVPLKIDKYPSYYLDLQVGSPPQSVRMLLDLTTSHTSIPISPWCEENDACYAKQTYTPSLSSTADVVPCNQSCSYCDIVNFKGEVINACFMVAYYNQINVVGTSSVQGASLTDVLSLSGISQNTNFVGFYEESAIFKTVEYDGMFGMGPQGNSSWFASLVASSSLTNEFSLCVDLNGGTLVLGGSDSSLYSGFLLYAPLQVGKVYSVSLSDIQVSGSSLAVDPLELNPAILDTTIGDTVINYNTFVALYSRISQMYCYNSNPLLGLCGEKNLFNGYCFIINPSSYGAYPEISFVIGSNVNLTLSASDYLYRHSSGYSCNSILSSSYYQSGTVLGTNLFRKYYATFKMDSGVIGFAKSNGCSKAAYILEYVSGDGQTDSVGDTLNNDLQVVVKHFNDSAPAVGVSVSWETSDGGGSITVIDAVTDENGYARASLTLGDTIGTNTVAATLSNSVGSPVIFTANAVKGFWFYFVNALFVVILSAALVAIKVYQYRNRKSLEDEIADKVEELRDLPLTESSDDNSLIDWSQKILEESIQ